MNKCENCGFLHYRTDPCRVAKKSTAARKDVRQRNLSKPRLATEVDGPPTVQGHGLAGTQALPVDTNSSRAMSPVATTSAGTVGNKDRQAIHKRGRGRPKTITDMKVYKREKARYYRAKLKLERENTK